MTYILNELCLYIFSTVQEETFVDSIFFLLFNDSDALKNYNEVQYESLYQSTYLDKGYEIIMYIIYHNLIVYVFG